MTTVTDNNTDQIAVHQHNMNDICNELQQRQQKQRNLVIFGLEEHNNDLEAAEALVCDVGAVAAISAVYRVGVVAGNRPRTLVVKFETERNRNEVYNNLCNLRGKQRWNKISVVPDLTKIQCLEEKTTYKKLLEEKKQKDKENIGDGVWKIRDVWGRKNLFMFVSSNFREMW